MPSIKRKKDLPFDRKLSLEKPKPDAPPLRAQKTPRDKFLWISISLIAVISIIMILMYFVFR